MKMKKFILIIIILSLIKSMVFADVLTTVERKEYEGKMVDFKYGVIYFNVYRFGKYHSKKRFPLSKVWKIEFNQPKNEGLESSFEIEQNYNKLRKGKRIKKISLNADQKWLDTGIKLKIGQEILFSTSGSIYINKNTMVYQIGELNLSWHKDKTMHNLPTGAIIARVGKNGKPFYVGDDKAPFHISQKGQLYIGINDSNFKDNSGKFTVKIYY
jgi:hypothetical protein